MSTYARTVAKEQNMAKETSAQRRAREFHEAEKARQKFEAEKPIRLINALAEANSLGVSASVYYRYDNVLYYSFRFEDWELSGTFAELEQWTLDSIENKLNEIRKERDHKKYLNKIKNELLERLTDEEKEALGLL